jgi:hypothetical protein
LTLLVLSLTAVGTNVRSQIRVESFSGSGQAGFANSDGQVEQFNRPHGLAVHAKGSPVSFGGLRGRTLRVL